MAIRSFLSSSHLSSQVPRALHLDEIAEIAEVMICFTPDRLVVLRVVVRGRLLVA